MAKHKNNQSGFSAVEFVIVMLIAAVFGFAVYRVYETYHPPVLATGGSQQASQAQNTPSLTAQDKANIAAGVLDYCVQANPGRSLRVVRTPNLDDTAQTQTRGDFVITNIGCSDTAKPVDQQDTTTRYLLKRAHVGWVVLSAYQQAPLCAEIDGRGVPTGFTQCYDSSNRLRNPT